VGDKVNVGIPGGIAGEISRGTGLLAGEDSHMARVEVAAMRDISNAKREGWESRRWRNGLPSRSRLRSAARAVWRGEHGSEGARAGWRRRSSNAGAGLGRGLDWGLRSDWAGAGSQEGFKLSGSVLRRPGS